MTNPNEITENDTPDQIGLKVAQEVVRLATERPDFTYSKPDAPLDAEFYYGSAVEVTDTGDRQELLAGGCLYVHKTVNDKEPTAGCLVGQAIVNTGLATLDQLSEHEYVTASTVITSLIHERMGMTPSQRVQYEHHASCVLDALDSTQGMQDDGTVWGDAKEPTVAALTGVPRCTACDDNPENETESA